VHLKKNINWFTYLSIHLYEILFVTAALLTVFGFIRKIIRRRAYSFNSSGKSSDGSGRQDQGVEF
jgi:hypothetical protein